MKKKLLLLLLALTGLAIFNSSLLADPSPRQSSLTLQSDDGFVMMTDATLGSFEIQTAPVTVGEYTKFLTAVANNYDPHHLYNDAMKSLITYHPSRWFESAYYSVEPNKADLPITSITLADAMRYCNWKENGESSAAPLALAHGSQGEYDGGTEGGSYFFNGEGMAKPNFGNATYALPSSEKLVAAFPQLVISSDDFNEWTVNASEGGTFISTDSVTGKVTLITRGDAMKISLFNDQQQQFLPPTIADGSEISANNGFRLVKKVPQMEQAAGPTKDLTSADNLNISLSAGNSSQQPVASPSSTVTTVKKLRISKRDQSLVRDATLVLDILYISGFITMVVFF